MHIIKKAPILIGVFCVIVLLLSCEQVIPPQTASELAPLTGTGTLEGQEVIVASELGGRIVALLADEGTLVSKGDVLVQLDDAQAHTQIAQARAAVAAAEANLANIQAGARPAEIMAAEAARDLAVAERVGAEKALLYAQTAISNPITLDLEIAEAQMQVDLAEQAIEKAKAELDAEKFNYHIYVTLKDNVSDKTRQMWDLRVLAMESAVTRAEAEQDAARADLYALYDLRNQPLEATAQLHGAQAAYTVTQAGVAVAEAQLAQLQAPTHPAEIAIAEAQLAQAHAGLTLALTQQSLLTLTAPITGVVASRSYYTGEIAAQGWAIFTVVDLDSLYLTLYVSESRIGEVHPGREVVVTLDAYPGETFTGTVSRIATEAEYTPGSVETAEDRARRVFAVRIELPNAAGRLRPGLPAAGVFLP